MPHDVFISYSYKDKKIADAVCSMLENNKVKCWIAPRDIAQGQEFARSVTRAIESTTVFLLIFSSNSNDSPQVTNELVLARSCAKIIVPFKVDECKLNIDFEYHLDSLHWLEVIAGDMEKSIEKLVEHICYLIPVSPIYELEKVSNDSSSFVPTYEGSDDYIFISYSHDDDRQVMPIIEELYKNDYRVWYDSGVEVGTEWPENIAEHIEKCKCFVAIISDNAMQSDNCRQEIFYAKDLKKDKLIIYIKDTKLSPGMKMLLNPIQALYKNRHRDDNSFYQALLKCTILKTCQREATNEKVDD